MATPNQEPKTIKMKELFDEISDQVACHVCKVAPRTLPIFRSMEKGVICSECKEKQGFLSTISYKRDMILEKILIWLPTSCRNKVNGCDFVQESKFIGSHEEQCQFQNVHCNFGNCVLKLPPAILKSHYKTIHCLDIDQMISSTFHYKPRPSYHIDVKLKASNFENGPKFLMSPGLINITMHNEVKTFFFHQQLHPAKQCFMFFMQMYGKNSEAQNYEYIIRLVDGKFGTTSYQGQMRSIDDNKIAIFKSRAAFIIPLHIAKQFLPEGKMSLEVKIQDLRTMNQNNEILPSAPPIYEEAMSDDPYSLSADFLLNRKCIS